MRRKWPRESRDGFLASNSQYCNILVLTSAVDRQTPVANLTRKTREPRVCVDRSLKSPMTTNSLPQLDASFSRSTLWPDASSAWHCAFRSLCLFGSDMHARTAMFTADASSSRAGMIPAAMSQRILAQADISIRTVIDRIAIVNAQYNVGAAKSSNKQECIRVSGNV